MSIDDSGPPPEQVWSRRFVRCGGMRHLVSIFLDGSLQTCSAGSSDGTGVSSSGGDIAWNEWRQDCLAYLLRLITQFAVDTSSSADSCSGTGSDDAFDSTTQESPRKKLRRTRSDQQSITRLTYAALQLMDVPRVVNILLTILSDSALPPPRQSRFWPIPFWGRVEVVHCAMALLVSLAHSTDDAVEELTTHNMFPSLLRRITLDAPEVSV